jgi:hypothetical protein
LWKKGDETTKEYKEMTFLKLMMMGFFGTDVDQGGKLQVYDPNISCVSVEVTIKIT